MRSTWLASSNRAEATDFAAPDSPSFLVFASPSNSPAACYPNGSSPPVDTAHTNVYMPPHKTPNLPTRQTEHFDTVAQSDPANRHFEREQPHLAHSPATATVPAQLAESHPPADDTDQSIHTPPNSEKPQTYDFGLTFRSR